MIFVLALLCAFFSAATYSEQSPTGEAAARQLASHIGGRFGRAPRVLIVARALPDDAAFARRLAGDLTASGGTGACHRRGRP